jgi:hypothetical protein
MYYISYSIKECELSLKGFGSIMIFPRDNVSTRYTHITFAKKKYGSFSIGEAEGYNKEHHILISSNIVCLFITLTKATEK